MRSFGLLAFASLMVVSCLAQQPGRTGTYSGRSGYSAPPRAARPGLSYSRGNNVGYSSGYARRTVVAPIYVAVPVYAGAYGYGFGPDTTDTTPDQGAPDQTTPGVIINQNFVPEQANPVVREVPDSVESYQAPGPPAVEPSEMGEAAPSDEPTIYLIALRDHSIMPALAYWTEGNVLKYVNMDHSINQVSVDLVDRDMSGLLNQQRNVEFRLPGR